MHFFFHLGRFPDGCIRVHTVSNPECVLQKVTLCSTFFWHFYQRSGAVDNWPFLGANEPKMAELCLEP